MLRCFTCSLVARILRAVCFAALCLGALPHSVQADRVTFKDGFVLEGKVVRDGKTIVDPGSQQMIELKDGFFMVDDGARRILFSPAYIDPPETQEFRLGEEAGMRRYHDAVGARSVPSIREVVDVTAWDEKWDRTIKLGLTDGRTLLVPQHLNIMNAHYARLDAYVRLDLPKYAWFSCYLTREFGYSQVKQLLGLHSDYKDDRTKTEAERVARRLKTARFIAQVGWIAEAGADLEQAAKDFPAHAAQINAEADRLIRKPRALLLAEEITRAHGAGQHDRAQKLLEAYPEDDAPPPTLAELRALRGKYEKWSERLKQVRGLLAELPPGVAGAADRKLFQEAAAAILTEVSEDNVDRLETFLVQAQQAERLVRQGKTPELGPDRLLALAVSGWLLGNASASTQVELTQRLWRARQVVLAVQRTHDSRERERLIADYDKEREPLPIDQLALLIGSLPPPLPEPLSQQSILELQAVRTLGRRGEIIYHVQVPPQYQHGRTYPVLFVLGPGGDQSRAMLDRWASSAAAHGYLLVSPEWARGFRASYAYSAEEHAAVVDVLVDLRRRFNVDSDRVFLAGFGAGAEMAYDVGLGHPDLFAGVLPMSGTPGRLPQRCYRNAMYLPFYVVTGDRSGESHKENYALFKDWILNSYPMIYAQYRGRGSEWFAAELPIAFEWMKNKRRAFPIRQLGRGLDGPFAHHFQTMRAIDNRFYWLSTDTILDRHLNDGAAFDTRVVGATFQASIVDNQIAVRTTGIKQLSIWLGRDRTGENSMIDFEKPVTVSVNLVQRVSRRVVKPSLATLLEDLYQRADRQRVFLARLDFNL